MAEERISARLAVILHADIVDSTGLVTRDEQRAHDRIRDTFQRFATTISRYAGEVIELRGDALLAEFSRASDAVSAALSFQSDQLEYNARLGDDLQPVVRVGVALGEVIIAHNTITGEGVVLAQRLEQLAAPGGLSITPAVREALPSRLPFDLENLGSHELKGFDEPIDVYRVGLQSGEVVPPPENVRSQGKKTSPRGPRIPLVAAVLAMLAIAVYGFVSRAPEVVKPEPQAQVEKPSIAVLPFNNMSGDPEQEYFADGITEDLTTDLSKISGLFVVARNSAFSFKGRQVDIRTVAEQLGVRYVLEGSIRRVNDQIRINAQLIDGSTGGHIWADRFDGMMADVFALQDRVNRNIVSALEVNLTDADEARFNRVETSLPEAYDLLLQGVVLYNVFNRDAIIESRDLFMRAAELDPDYARAWANIALTHATEVNFFWSEDRDKSIREGLKYAAKAIELDDSIPQIYLTRSILYLSQRQHQAALEAARRTIEVHPGYADGHATLGFISSYSGRLKQALEALADAKRYNPNGTGVYLGIESRVLFLMKQYDEALLRAEESVDRNPGFDGTQLNLAAIYAKLGRLDDASWTVEEALAINPRISLARLRRDNLYKSDDDINHYLDALKMAGVPE